MSLRSLILHQISCNFSGGSRIFQERTDTPHEEGFGENCIEMKEFGPSGHPWALDPPLHCSVG